MQGEITEMELLAEFEIIHIVENRPFDGLGKLDSLLLIEIDPMGRF